MNINVITVIADKLYGNASLQLTRLSVHTLNCAGQHLTYFPFEEHICTLKLTAKTRHTLLKPLAATAPDQYTSHFIVEKVQLKSVQKVVDGYTITKAILRVHLKRLFGFYVVVVFIPSFILLGINSAALWVLEPPEYRLCTSIFVVVTFFVQWVIIACNSPVSSTIRAIDVWMSYCTVHSLLHLAIHVIINAVSTPDPRGRSSSLFSSMSSRPISRLRQIKPLETTNLYDALLAKLASEENENTWTHAYWIMFSARVVSPVLTLLFLATYWPFVVFYTKLTL